MKKLTYISCLGTGLLATTFSSLGVTLDLLTVGTSGTINGAQFVQGNGGSGTGMFPSFVQIGGNDTTHDAYNTTVNGVGDNGSSDTFNHEITLSQLPIVNISGTDYYSFLLDINENNNATDRYLSLDSLTVLTSVTANQLITPLPVGTTRYNMGANNVVLDYTLNPGSGQWDMEFLVPTANFAGALPGDFVYLYSQFGVAGINPAGLPVGDYGTSDGFEEWAFNPTPPVNTVPDGGATLALLCLGLAGMGFYSRGRFLNQARRS